MRLRRREIFGAVAVWAAGALVFFRHAVFSAGDRVMGMTADTRLAVFLHEHWWDVVRRRESWLSPRFFFPERATLGYSDTFALNTWAYIPLRALGVESFLAFQLTVLLTSLVGFVAMYVVLRWGLRLAVPAALVLTSVATFAGVLAVQSHHSQLFFLHWLPVVALLSFVAVRWSGPRRLVAAGGAGILFGLVAYSGFYVAWFAAVAVLGGALVAVVVAVVVERRGGATWQVISARVRRSVPALAAASAGLGLVALPFLLTYGPVIAEGRPRSLAVARHFTNPPSELLYVGDGNLLWGWANRPNEGGIFGLERITGLSPVLAVTTLVSIVVLIRPRNAGRTSWPVVAGCAGAAIVLIALGVRLGGWTPFSVAWSTVPGARAIRVPVRAWLLLTPVAVVIVALAARRVRWSTTPVTARVLLVVASALLIGEQLTSQSTWEMRRSDEAEALATVPAAPPSCRAFYLVGPGWTFDEGDIDAMMIAMRSGLPTSNGYSGMRPLGHDAEHVAGGDNTRLYVEAMRGWLERSGVEGGVCGYLHRERRWLD
jgi:hypothetical protein